MRVRLRLVAVVLALLVPALVLARWTLAAGAPGEPISPPSLPSRVGEWTATSEQTLDAEVLTLIEPAAYLVRLYEAPARAPIWLYMGVYAGRAGTGTGAHHPEVCYPAQGWEVLKSQALALPLGGAQELRAQQLSFHRGGAREAVLYWFQPAERWPLDAGAEELLRMLDAVAGRPQYAFVRLSARSDGSPAAADDLAEFAVGIAPAIRGVVERVGTRGVQGRSAAR